MPSTLPILPLHRVLVPGQRLVAQVHDPRLRPMFRPDEPDRVGVAFIRPRAEVRSGLLHHEVGTVARVRGVRAAHEGRLLVDTIGEDRFAVLEMVSGAPFPTAIVTVGERRDDVPPPLLDAVYRALGRYLAILAESGHDADVTVTPVEDPVAASYRVASRIRLTMPELQELLEIEAASERLERELRILERETALLRRMM